MLTINNLKIQYNNTVYITKSHLDLYPQQIIGIKGLSGTGKSSFLDTLALENNFASIAIDHICLNELSNEQKDQYKLENITYISQKENYVPNLTCRELLQFADRTATQDYNELLCKVGLSDINDSTKLSSLSLGQQALFAIAYAIIKDDPVILLDEILASLDYENKIHVLELLKELSLKDKYIIMTYHEDQEHLEQIESYLGTILEFKNQTIEIIKKEDNSKEIKTQSRTENNQLLFKGLIRNHLTANILYLLFISTALTFALFIYYDSSSVTSHLSYISDMLNRFSDQCTVFYSGAESQQAFEYGDQSPIDQNELEEIKQLDSVSDMYPLIPFEISEFYNWDSGEYNENPEIGKIDVNGEIKEIDCQEQKYLISAYIDNSYDDVCDGNIDEEGTMYISKSMAEALDIDNVDDPVTVEMIVLIPKDSEIDTISYSYNNGPWYEENRQWITYQECTISARIRGIITEYYPYSYMIDFFLPQNVMYSIYEENKIENTNYLPGMYILKKNSNTSLEELKADLKEIDSNIQVEIEGQEVIDAWQSILKTNQSLKRYIYVLAAAIVILCIADSYTTYRNDTAYMKVIHKIGVSNRTIRSLLLKKVICNTIITVVSGSLLNLIVFKMMDSQRQFAFSYSSFISKNIVILDIVILLAISIITQIITIVEVSIHEKV